RRTQASPRVSHRGESRIAKIARTGETLHVIFLFASRGAPSHVRRFPSAHSLPANGPGYLRTYSDTGSRVTGRLGRAAALSRVGSLPPSGPSACGTVASDALGTNRATTNGPDNRPGAAHRNHQPLDHSAAKQPRSRRAAQVRLPRPHPHLTPTRGWLGTRQSVFARHIPARRAESHEWYISDRSPQSGHAKKNQRSPAHRTI